jgi:hypothetical protein
MATTLESEPVGRVRQTWPVAAKCHFPCGSCRTAFGGDYLVDVSARYLLGERE